MASPKREKCSQRRLTITESSDLFALVERCKSDLGDSIKAEVADISPKGIKLAVTSPLQFGEVVSMTLKSKSLNVDLNFQAVVRWVKPGTEQWLAGLALKGTIPFAILQKMAVAGYLERRRYFRHRAAGTAMLRVQGETHGVEVELVDQSEEGVCVLSPKPVEVGQRALLTFGEKTKEAMQATATAKWQSQSEDGYSLGFEIPADQIRPFMSSCGLSPARLSKRTTPLARNSLILLLGTIAIALVLWNFGWLSDDLFP